MSTLSLNTPVEQREPAAAAVGRTSRLLFIPLLLLQAGFFLYVAQHRLIDDDEGYYLLASRLVMQHKAPYLDFFYTQAPLLPYVYAAWFKLAGASWYAARIFCALLSTLVGGLLYYHVCRETGKWLAGACTAFLYATSTLIFAWYPIVKTFALAMLFLFPAYLIFTRLSPSTRGWMVGMAGVLFGLSVDTRSYVVGLAPVFLWWLLRQRSGRSTARIAWFLGGLGIGIVPSLVLFLASPDAFLFNNLGYHAMRSGVGLIGDWHDKMMVAAATMGGAYTGFQFSVVSLSALALVVLQRARRASALLALLLALVLGLVSLLPTPASIQYFSLIMPFLIVTAVTSASDYLDALRSARTVRLVGAGCALLLVGFFLFAVPIFRQYLFTGRKVPGLQNMADAPNWTLSQVTAVSKAVDELAMPGEQVASFWPGYIFASWANPYPGFENNFGMWVAPSFAPQKRQQYHIISLADVNQEFARHGPRLVVVGNQGPWNAAPEYAACAATLRAYSYRLVGMVGDTSIYQCCSQ